MYLQMPTNTVGCDAA